MHTEALIAFLEGLAENNNKAWFVMNKPSYDILREEFTALVGAVIGGINRFDGDIVGVEAKKALFRINRDVRFSNDKSPYKTTFSAAISPQGKKAQAPVYYFHINAQGQLFIAGGCYQPDKEATAKIRQQLAISNSLNTILKRAAFKQMYGALDLSEALVRPPKGYTPETPNLDLIRLKNWVAMRTIDLRKDKPDDFAKEIVSSFKVLYPLNVWLRAALEQPLA